MYININDVLLMDKLQPLMVVSKGLQLNWNFKSGFKDKTD